MPKRRKDSHSASTDTQCDDDAFVICHKRMHTHSKEKTSRFLPSPDTDSKQMHSCISLSRFKHMNCTRTKSFCQIRIITIVIWWFSFCYYYSHYHIHLEYFVVCAFSSFIIIIIIIIAPLLLYHCKRNRARPYFSSLKPVLTDCNNIVLGVGY